MAVVGSKTVFDSAIRAQLGGINGERGQSKMFAQFLAQLFTQVGHVRERSGPFLPKPFPNLFGPEFLFTDRQKIVFQVGEGELPDIL
jgi:hypothetical protein